MTEERSLDAQMADIAKKASAQYARACWWADPQDLHQQAWAILLDFKVNWAPKDPTTGEIDRRMFGNYGYRAVMRQLSRYLWRQSAPVSLPDRACGPEVGVGLHRADLTTVDAGDDRVLDAVLSPEQALLELKAQQEVQRWMGRARRRLLSLLGEPVDDWGKAPVAVVLDGEDLDRVCTRLRLPSREVQRWVRKAQRLLKGDPVLTGLLEGRR